MIHKNVRRDLIPSLPLPRRMIDYLNTPHYYSEHFIDIAESRSEEPEALSYRSVSPMTTRHLVSQRDIRLTPAPNVPVNNYIIINNTNNRQS